MFAFARITALAIVAALSAGGCADFWKCESAQCMQDTKLDQEVRRQINASTLRFFNIDVQTRDDAVYLMGLVDTELDRGEAEQIASAVPGVKRVYNGLQLMGAGY